MCGHITDELWGPIMRKAFTDTQLRSSGTRVFLSLPCLWVSPPFLLTQLQHGPSLHCEGWRMGGLEGTKSWSLEGQGNPWAFWQLPPLSQRGVCQGLRWNSLLGEQLRGKETSLFTLAAPSWPVDSMLWAGQSWTWAGLGGGGGNVGLTVEPQRLLGRLYLTHPNESPLSLSAPHPSRLSQWSGPQEALGKALPFWALHFFSSEVKWSRNTCWLSSQAC